MAVATETNTTSPFLAVWEQFERTPAARGPSWLTPLRKAAIARFAERGLPTTRHEDWRYTNLAPLARLPLRLPAGPEPGARDSAAIEKPGAMSTDLQPILWDSDGATVPRLVFINGRFAPALSHVPALRGLRAGSLAAALGVNQPGFEAHLNRYASARENALTDLNTAFLHDGAYVHIAPGAVLETPLHLVFIADPMAQATPDGNVGHGGPTLHLPRVLVVAGANSQAQIVESYFGARSAQAENTSAQAEDATYFTNAVTEIVAGENAVIDHYKVQREAPDAFHVGALYLHQGRAANVRSHCLSLGGGLVRHEISAILAGEGGDCHLNGLYVVAGEQHVDNHLRVEHAAPHTSSREVFKGILDDRARGVFTGRIFVHKGAQKTDGKQTNHNLLLSDEAQVDTKPQLEIFADDVKCTHGATIGQLDEDAVFYLRSRGVPAPAARGLLTYAFAAESLDEIRIAALRNQIGRLVRARLPQGELFEDLP